MARNNFLDTQTGGSSNILNDVTSEESQNIDLSPKEAKAKEEVEKEVEKEAEKTAENLSVEDKPKEVDGDSASGYIPVSETSVDKGIPTSAKDSTAKQLLSGGMEELEDKQKIFNNIGGTEEIYKEAKNNVSPPVTDTKMDDLMAENNVVIKNLNVDNSSVFDTDKINSLKTNYLKKRDQFGGLSRIVDPIYDVDEETKEDLITVTGVKIDTELDREIYKNREENKSNSLISKGIDGVYRYDLGGEKNQDGTSAGGPTEDDEPGPNGYYTMNGRAYYKNKKGEWYKLYPKDKKNVRKEGYNTYNSSWIKIEDPRRIRAVENKSQFQTYRDVKDKNLLNISNDLITRMQEAYSDPNAERSGDFQYEAEVTVSPGLLGPWGYEDEISKEEARKKISGDPNKKFLDNGEYKFAGKNYVKENGKWFYKNDKGSLESIYGKDKQIIKLERRAIPKSLLMGKNTAFKDFVEGLADIDVSETMLAVAETVKDWWSNGAKDKVINGFDWIKNIAARSNPSIINNQAREIAEMISSKWTSGTLTEAEYELIRSFGTVRDEYLNYGENKAIFEESYGDLGNIWRSPDKKKDLLGSMYKDDLKPGMEMIAFLANGGKMTKNIKGDGLYHVGGDYLMKRGGRWMNFDGSIVDDKDIVEVFNSAGQPGMFDISELVGLGLESSSGIKYSVNLLDASKKSAEDRTISEEIALISNGRRSIVKDTDLYKIYKSNPIISMLIDQNLKSSGLLGVSLIDVLQNPENQKDNIDFGKILTEGLLRDGMGKSYLKGVFDDPKSINNVIRSISDAFSAFNRFETDKQRIKWFSENSFSESGLTDGQRKAIELAQDDASKLIDELNTSTFTMERLERSDLMRSLNFSTQKNRISEFVSQIDQLVEISNQTNELKNQIKETGKSKDLVFLERKDSYLRKFSKYMPGSLTENQESAMSLFTQKKNLANYILELEQNGLVSISKEGKLSYTDKASKMGKEYIASMENKISDFNGMIDLNRSQCLDENIAEKAELEASIRNTDVLIYKELDRLFSSESKEEYKSANTAIERLKQTKEVNEAKLDQIKTNNYTVLLTNGEEVAEDLMGSVTEGFFNPYLMALEGVKEYSPKNKFDLVYEQMSDRMIELVNSGEVNIEYSGHVLASVKDLLSWDGWLELSSEEKEYYQLARTLKASLPLYLNNEYSFEENDIGFFNSLIGSFYKTAFPNVNQNQFGVDMDIESSQAGAMIQMMESTGITVEDLTGYDKAIELDKKSKEEPDLGSRQFWGQITGGSLLYMGTIPLGGWVTGVVFKSAVALQKLTVGAKGLTIAEKAYNAIPAIYMNTLGRTKFGKFLKQPFQTAYAFERAGTIFGAADEEMTALGGFMGGAGVATFQLLGKKVSGTVLNKFAKSLFGSSPEAAAAWKNGTTGFQIGAGFGSGELVEETMQVFAKAFNAMDDTKKMYEVLEQSFGDFDKISKHIVGSFVMGVMFGFGMSSRTRSIYQGLDSETKAKVDAATKAIGEELNASMESTEEYINGQKKKISNIEKNSIIDDSKDTEGVSSEEQVGQESVQEESIEETSKEKTSTDRVLQEEQVQEETQEEQSKIEDKSTDELEKRQAVLEDSKQRFRNGEITEEQYDKEIKEDNEIDRLLMKREWDSVVNSPIDNAIETIEELKVKNKTQPNGFGTYAEASDLSKAKNVAQKYTTEEVTKEEALSDFKKSFILGSPDLSYADAIMAKESVRVLLENGYTNGDLVDFFTSTYTQDGFSKEQGLSVLNSIVQKLKVKNSSYSSETVTEGAIDQVQEETRIESKIENEEQAKQEEQHRKDSKVEYEALSKEEQSGFKQKAKQELEAEKTKGRVTEEQINKRAEEIYAKDGLRINIGKNANQAKGQRVTVTVNKDSEYGGVDMDITDEFGSIGNVKGSYDGDGNFDIEEISIVEGKRGQQYASETISVINENTNNNVIISGNTESTEAVGNSLAENLEATQDSDGNYVVNNTTENIEGNQDATIEYNEDPSIADRIRSLKFGKDSQVTTDENGNPIPAPKKNSLNFFDAAWNASMEAAAQVVEKGGSLYKTLSTARSKFKKTAFYQSFETTAEKEEQLGKFMLALEEQLGTEEFSKAQKALTSLKTKAMKKFKDSPYYQSLKPYSKARKEAVSEFEEKLENDADRILSDKMKKKEKLDLDKMVGEYSAEQRQSQGPLDLKLSIAEKIKANKDSDLGVIKQEIIQYIKKALPESTYTKAKLTSLINSVEGANTIATAQKLFNKVDSISKKDYEKKRKEAYKETYTRINTSKKGSINQQMTYKSGKQRMSTESIKAYNEFLKNNDFSQAALEAMSLEELVVINNTLSEIVETGKFDQKALNEQNETIKRKQQGDIIEGFERLNGKKKEMTAEQVLDSEAVFRGSFVIDGKYFSPSDAKVYIKRMNKEGTPPSSIKFYKKVDLKQDSSGGFRSSFSEGLQRTLSLSDFSYKLKNLYAGKFGLLTKGYKGNDALKNLADKIDRGVKWAYTTEQQENGDFKNQLNAHLKATFGKSFSDVVGQSVGTSSLLPSSLKASPKNPNQFFNEETEFEGRTKKISNDELIDLYLYGKDTNNDSEVRKSLSIKYNMDAIDAYVESNPDLLNHAEWIENQYNEIAKNKYSNVLSKYKGNVDIEFRDGYYYPRNVAKEGTQTEEEAATAAINDAGGLQGLLISENTAANSHVKARTGLGNSELKVTGATEKLMNYIKGMNHVNAFYETAVDISMITNNAAISNAIELNGGKNALKNFKEHASLILGGEKAKLGSAVVDYASTAAVIGTLGLNTANIPKQLSSSFHWMTAGIGYGMGPMKSTINTVANVFVKKKGETDEQYATRIDIAKMIMNSHFVRDRWTGASIDASLNNVIAEGQGKGGINRLISKGSKFALLYTRLGDMGGVVLGGIPFTVNLYNHYRKSEADGGRAMSHEEAMQAAYVAFTSEANDIQQSSRGDHKSLSQRSPLIKAITMYTTSQQAIIKKTMNAYKALVSRTKLSKEEKTQAIVDLIYYPTFGNFLFNATASGMITGWMGLDDEEDPAARERLYYDVTTDSVIGGNLQGMGPVNLVFGSIYNSLKDRDYFNNLPFQKNMADIAKEGVNGLRYLSGSESYVKIGGVDVSTSVKFEEFSKKENQEVLRKLVKENKSLISDKIHDRILNNDWNTWSKADVKEVEKIWNQKVQISKDAGILDRLQEMAFPETGTFAEVYDAITDSDIEAITKELTKGLLDFGLGEDAVDLFLSGEYEGGFRELSGWPQADENQLSDRVTTKETAFQEIKGEKGSPRPGGTEKGDNMLWDAYQLGKKFVASALGSEADYEPYTLKRFLQQGYYEAGKENQKKFREYLQEAEGLSQHEINKMANGRTANDQERMNEYWTKHINYGIKYQENKEKGKDKKIKTGGRKVKRTVEGTTVEGTIPEERKIKP